MVNKCQSARYMARFLQSDSKSSSPPCRHCQTTSVKYLDMQKDVAKLHRLCEQLAG